MTNATQSLPPGLVRGFLSGPLGQCAAGAAVVVAMVVWLRIMGRPLVCDCGTIALWDGDARSPGASQQFADWYSALHLIFGMALFVFLDRMRPRWPTSWKLLAALASSAVWEGAENTPMIIALFGAPEGAPAYDGDSILNALGDTLFVAAGFLTARTLPLPATIGVAVLLEIAISVAISDGFVIGTLRLFGVPV